MEETKLLPKNDLVFQRIFGKVGNEKIAKRFIELIIGEEIESIDLDVNRELIREKEEEKLGRLDVRAKLNGGISCNIEIQLKNHNDMEKRILYYWSKLHAGQLKEGDKYKDIKRTISIVIMGENLKKLKDIKNYHTKWSLVEQKRKDLILTEDIEIHVLELKKMKALTNKKDELRLWLMFLENPENEEVQKEMEENTYLKQAMKEYEHLRGSEGFWRLVELREKNLRDAEWIKDCKIEEAREEARVEGREKGRKEGREEARSEARKEKAEMIKKMLKEKIDIKTIILVTGLKEEEIKKMINE